MKQSSGNEHEKETEIRACVEQGNRFAAMPEMRIESERCQADDMPELRGTVLADCAMLFFSHGSGTYA